MSHWSSSRKLRRFLAAVILIGCGVTLAVRAQNIQFTQGSGGSGLENSISIPLQSYPGRGVSLPVTLNYSSRVWRIGHLRTVNDGSQYTTITEALYAEYSTAGWTTGLDLPVVEWPKVEDTYYYSGKAYCQVCQSNLAEYRIARVFIHMPGGATHELRKSDTPFQGGPDMSGTFYAVDGSRLRYDSTGATGGTLYLPDGARYVLGGATPQFIDRNGNTLTYHVANRQWSDTLGRVIGMPWPVQPTAGSHTYSLPGFNGGTLSYTLVWSNLADALTPDANGNPPALRYVSSQYLPYPNQTPTNSQGDNYPQGAQTPALFFPEAPGVDAPDTPLVGRHQAQGETFNPVVLQEIILPNGLSYHFSYNVYGEMDQVTYPGGAFERYSFARLPTVDDANDNSAGPYTQANRGVTQRQISVDGPNGTPATWQYNVATSFQDSTVPANTRRFTVTAPNGTVTATYSNDVRAPLAGGQHPTRYWPFGFESKLNGQSYEERVYAPAPQGGAMLRRSLTQWEQTANSVARPAPGSGTVPA